MVGGIFITVKDVQKLLGCDRYNTAQSYLQTVKEATKKRSRHITIKEFCEHEELDFDYIWRIIRPGTEVMK